MNPVGKRQRSKGGKREDIDCYVRSIWEANIFRYLQWLRRHGNISDFAYEPDEFTFPVKRGPGSFYRPDFKVWKNAQVEYWEVKGYLSPISKTKLRRMAKYYPHIRIELIDRKHYQEIKKWAKLIPGWE